MKSKPSATCPICAAPAVHICARYPGYRAPDEYDIFDCCYCDLQFASPFSAIGEIYEGIYSAPEIVPGYDRYAAYAKAVATSDKPLDFLAQSEAMYWFVARALRDISPTSSIIEVGSGYGYLTYAISRAGYRIKGVDVAASAVEAARRRFGDLYHCEDITTFSKRLHASTDVIVMTEVLEHLDQPLTILSAIRESLRPGGSLLVTTPSRDFHPPGALWCTDLPPVHLAWYSETSLREMARRVNMTIRFQDFSEFHGRRVAGIRPQKSQPSQNAILNADNSVRTRSQRDFHRPSFRKWWQARWPALARLERSPRYARHAMTHFARSTEVLGAVLTRAT
jgi:SAM-dependent methyltransferase